MLEAELRAEKPVFIVVVRLFPGPVFFLPVISTDESSAGSVQRTSPVTLWL